MILDNQYLKYIITTSKYPKRISIKQLKKIKYILYKKDNNLIAIFFYKIKVVFIRYFFIKNKTI